MLSSLTAANLSIEKLIKLEINIMPQIALCHSCILGKIVTIFYKESTAPPQIPTFVVVDFPKYIGPPWDERNPTHLPIPAVKRNGRAQIPLKMAWALTIHKSQGMTLPKATIDIGKTERQGLTFTAISRVPSLQDLRINPAFSFDRYSKMKDNKNIARRKHAEEILRSMPPPDNLLQPIL
jgi:hypothetical protein